MREIKTGLSGSRVSYNSVVTTEADDQSSTALLCQQMSCLTILDVEMQAVEVDAQRHQHAQANLGDLRWSEVSCQLPLCDAEKEEQHC